MKAFKILLLIAAVWSCWNCAFAQTGVVITNLVSFNGTNGEFPDASLIQASDGNLYGTTRLGGTNQVGTVFRINLDGTLTTLVNFGGTGTNGTAPEAPLIQDVDGNLYGTSQSGGSGYGTAFGITTNGLFVCSASFAGTNGNNVIAGLVQGSDGNLYGTTINGGIKIHSSYNDGTVFQMTTNGLITSLHSFLPSQNLTNTGLLPSEGLVQGLDGDFYGTTLVTKSTVGDFGTIYKIDTNGNLTTLIIFNNSDGSTPNAPLTLGSDGNFYGYTSKGGSNNCGTVFQLSTNGVLTTLYSFDGTNGFNAYGPTDASYGRLCQASDGKFYGETISGGLEYVGGPYGSGTIFQITPSGVFNSLYSFGTNASVGSYPVGGLIQASDGNFYGVTCQGGANSYGTIFRLTIPLQPVFQSISQSNGLLNLNWSSVANQSYQLQYTTDLTSGNWNNLSNSVVATTGITSGNDTIGSDSQRFYRVVLMQ